MASAACASILSPDLSSPPLGQAADEKATAPGRSDRVRFLSRSISAPPTIARPGVPFARGYPARRACLQARELLLARRELLTLEQAPNQCSKLLVRQRRKPQQARVQSLQLAFRHRVEVDTTNTLLGTRALQPTQEDLRGTRVCDRLLTQATLDLRVGRWLPSTAGCGAR
jgi:hypothetical protein